MLVIYVWKTFLACLEDVQSCGPERYSPDTTCLNVLLEDQTTHGIQLCVAYLWLFVSQIKRKIRLCGAEKVDRGRGFPASPVTLEPRKIAQHW